MIPEAHLARKGAPALLVDVVSEEDMFKP